MKEIFYMIFHFKAAQNLVAEHFVRGNVDWPCSYDDEQK